jgi:hypothetical protein
MGEIPSDRCVGGVNRADSYCSWHSHAVRCRKVPVGVATKHPFRRLQDSRTRARDCRRREFPPSHRNRVRRPRTSRSIRKANWCRRRRLGKRSVTQTKLKASGKLPSQQRGTREDLELLWNLKEPLSRPIEQGGLEAVSCEPAKGLERYQKNAAECYLGL